MTTNDSQSSPAKLALSADEVAAVLGVSRAKVYEAIQVGELPSVRLGRHVLVPVRSLTQMFGIEEPDVRPPAPPAGCPHCGSRQGAGVLREQVPS